MAREQSGARARGGPAQRPLGRLRRTTRRSRSRSHRAQAQALAAIGAGMDALPPRFVVEIPAHSCLEIGFKRGVRTPAKFALSLRAVDRIPMIVTGTVGDELNETRVRAHRIRREPV